jgi:hypothetical protein
MAGYTNLLLEWDFTVTDEETSGRRVLILDSNGTQSLPALYDEFPSTEAPSGFNTTDVKCRSIKITKPSGVERWECDYSTKPSGFGIQPEDETESLQVMSEYMFLPSTGGKSSATDADTGEGLEGGTTKLFITALYSQVKVYSSFSAAISAAVMHTSMGKVLEKASGTFDGFWLYLGADMDEYRASDGSIKTKSTRKYAYKRIDQEDTQPTASPFGWNSVWFPNTATWAITDPLIYPVVSAFPDTMPFTV